jgi:hypothetical protein
MSANLVVDIGNTCLFGLSIAPTATVSPASGVVIGRPVDLKNSDTYTNLFVVGGPSSGVLIVQVQSAPAISGLIMSGGLPTSGSFTDPTSGLAEFPTGFSSGGLLYLNSGLFATVGGGGLSGQMSVGTFGAGLNPIFQSQGGTGNFPVSGSWPVFGSGGVGFGAFLSPGPFVRANIIGAASGFISPVAVGFLANRRTTGSGGGSTMSPQSGTVNV